MTKFLLRSDFGAPLGFFVASNEAEALDMLARRHGYESAAAAGAEWRRQYKAYPVADGVREEPRRAHTNLNAILHAVILTAEDEGITGHLVRLALYKMADRIKGIDIENWLFAHTYGSEDEEELAHWRQKMLYLVHTMRADALDRALRDVGLQNLGIHVSRAALLGRGYPAILDEVDRVLDARMVRAKDKSARHLLKVAQDALVEARRLEVTHA